MAEMITGRIYVVRSPNTNMVYVGSTTLSLKKRFDMHLSDWRYYSKSKRCTYSKLIIDEGEAYIELLEEVQVESVRELEMIEQQWLDKTPNTINKNKAYISEEERLENVKKYYETHRQVIIEQSKKYNETHKEKIKEQQKIYYEKHKEKKRIERIKQWIRCEVCDCLILSNGEKQHELTKKHARNLEMSS